MVALHETQSIIIFMSNLSYVENGSCIILDVVSCSQVSLLCEVSVLLIFIYSL